MQMKRGNQVLKNVKKDCVKALEIIGYKLIKPKENTNKEKAKKAKEEVKETGAKEENKVI